MASVATDLPRFERTGVFQHALKKAVDEYFATTGRPRRGLPAMYVKTAVIVSWATASWALLVFWSASLWTAVPLALSLGLALAGIGMAVMHDANHGAYARRAWLNRTVGFALDLLGGSSALWRQKHNVIHHTYTNVEGFDDDLETGGFLRLSPHQPRRRLHRFQHLYAWPLYALLVVRWIPFGDIWHVIVGRYGRVPIPRPEGRQLALFVVGKFAWLSWAVVLPALLHPLLVVVSMLLLVMFVEGLVLATTFQLAHCCDRAAFVPVAGDDLRTGREWAVHQLATTVDFAPRNRLLSWYVGGLNYQVEHHLFPSISHLHYPALARVVACVARERGELYRSHATLRSALASHYRWLRTLGRESRSELARVEQ